MLLVEPAFYHAGTGGMRAECKAIITEKTSCSPRQCGDKESSPENRNCEKNHCNPILGCPGGNFYIHQYATVSLNGPVIRKQKNIVVNDNRLFSRLSECWHPPELSSLS